MTDPATCDHARSLNVPEADGGTIRFDSPGGQSYTAGTVTVCPDCGSVTVRFDSPPESKGPFGARFRLTGKFLEAAGARSQDQSDAQSAPAADPVVAVVVEALRSNPRLRESVLGVVSREVGMLLRGVPRKSG